MVSIIRCSTILLIAFLNISCSESSERGEELLGLKVGETKEEVLSRLSNNVNVTHIRSDVDEVFVVKKNSKNIPISMEKMLYEKGVVVERGAPKLNIRITFSDDYVASIYLAPVNKNEDLGLKVGMKQKVAVKILIELLANKKIDRVYNFMPESKWIEIKNIGEAERRALLSGDTWSFNENHKYSAVKLHFVGDALSSIDYNWTPLELP